tara:strand:+ start:819 stop:1040 length:222 start_codon:yes stop_codon:yes gene_type:complete
MPITARSYAMTAGKRQRRERMGRGIGGFDVIVTNVIFCVFYPEEDIEKVKELVEEFRSLNPDYRFKLARRKNG